VVKMLIKNFIIGSVCILFLMGAYVGITLGSEEGGPAPPANENTEPEQVIKLIEEQKVYLATPKKTFQYYCGPCHGDSANGKGIFFTIDLKPKPRDLTDVEYMAKLTDNYLQNFITKGSVAMEKSDLCPPWGNTLDEDRIKGVIAYLRNLTIAKSKAEEKPAEKEIEGEVEGEAKEGVEGKEKVVKVSVGEQKGTPKVIIWSVLIALCVIFVYAARSEWKKLGAEEASK